MHAQTRSFFFPCWLRIAILMISEHTPYFTMYALEKPLGRAALPGIQSERTEESIRMPSLLH